MKFLIVEPPPLPILIPIGIKHSPQDPSNNLSQCSSLNVRDRVSQPYSTNGNIVVLYDIVERNLIENGECDGDTSPCPGLYRTAACPELAVG